MRQRFRFETNAGKPVFRDDGGHFRYWIRRYYRAAKEPTAASPVDTGECLNGFHTQTCGLAVWRVKETRTGQRVKLFRLGDLQE